MSPYQRNMYPASLVQLQIQISFLVNQSSKKNASNRKAEQSCKATRQKVRQFLIQLFR